MATLNDLAMIKIEGNAKPLPDISRVNYIVTTSTRFKGNVIQPINHYPMDCVVCFANTFPLDRDLSVEYSDIHSLDNLPQVYNF